MFFLRRGLVRGLFFVSIVTFLSITTPTLYAQASTLCSAVMASPQNDEQYSVTVSWDESSGEKFLGFPRYFGGRNRRHGLELASHFRSMVYPASVEFTKLDDSSFKKVFPAQVTIYFVVEQKSGLFQRRRNWYPKNMSVSWRIPEKYHKELGQLMGLYFSAAYVPVTGGFSPAHAWQWGAASFYCDLWAESGRWNDFDILGVRHKDFWRYWQTTGEPRSCFEATTRLKEELIISNFELIDKLPEIYCR